MSPRPVLGALFLSLSRVGCAYVGGTVGAGRESRAPLPLMRANKGPFPLPDPPADFAGAQWAPHVFQPFEINIPAPDVSAAAAEIKAVLEAEADAAPSPAAPAPASVDVPSGHFAVTLKSPDGDLSFAIPPDTYLLDHTDELAEEDEAYANLPYACRAGSCSACAAKVLSGEVDNSDGSFLSDEQKAEGFILSCTTYAKSDVVIQTDMEEDLF
jgi:2Fe-2S type ferredoxin